MKPAFDAVLRWVSRAVLVLLPLAGYLPRITDGRVHVPPIIWPPIGSIVDYAGGLASAFVLGLGSLPEITKARTRGRWFAFGLLATFVFLATYATLLSTYVKRVGTPRDGMQFRTVGSVRTPASLTCPRNVSDEDLLECGGLNDGDIETMWTASSVRQARLELFLSYVLCLGALSIVVDTAPKSRRK